MIQNSWPLFGEFVLLFQNGRCVLQGHFPPGPFSLLGSHQNCGQKWPVQSPTRGRNHFRMS